MSDIVEIVRKMVGSMIKPDLLIGKVISFDESNWTIKVELNQGATIPAVTIRSVMNDETTGIFVEPVIGSMVLCGMTDGRIENMTVLSFSQIKSMKISPAAELILRTDAFGGIPKIQELINNLNKLKNAQEAQNNAIIAAFNAVGVGSAANGPGAATLFNTQMSGVQVQFEDMENKNVKHG